MIASNSNNFSIFIEKKIAINKNENLIRVIVYLYSFEF